MPNINKFLKPKLKLIRGTRLTSGLFIGASILVAAGILFAANMYYNIDTSTVMVEEKQQVTGLFTATTTQITVNTGSAALTVTQSGTGYGAVITGGNVGIGTTTPAGLLTVATTTGPALLYVDKSSGNVGIATSTPSALLAVAGNIIGSGNLILYGSATSTFAAPIQVTQIKITGPNTPTAGLVLTATDALGNANWQATAGGLWTESSDNLYIYPTTLTHDVAISTTTARYDLDVWGNAGFGTTTDYNIPLLLVNSNLGRVGIATSTPSAELAVKGSITSSGNLIVYGSATSTFGGPIETTGFKMTTNPTSGYVLTSDVSGYATWQAAAGGSNWEFIGANAIRPTSTIGIIVSASSTFAGDLNIQGDIRAPGALTVYSDGGALTLYPVSGSNVEVTLGGAGLFKVGAGGEFYIDASGNATTTGSIYAAGGFRSGATDATIRKSGEQIVRGVAPILGFDLPAQCNTACTSPLWATISRNVLNTDYFPANFPGTTRYYRFSIRYASASSTASSIWQIATSTENSSYQFTLNSTGDTDINKGYATTTNTITSLPTNGTSGWFLRVQSPPTTGYDFRVYEVLLIGLDQVD